MTDVPQSKAPPAPPPPPAPAPPARAQNSVPTDVKWGKSKGKRRIAHRVGLFGPGGIGKSTLCGLAPGARFIDLERGTDDLTVERIDAPDGRWTWELLRAAIQHESLWKTAGTVVVDTVTAAEELCIDFILRTVPTHDNDSTRGIEGYGYGKGYTYVYEEFLKLLGDLDAHVRAGRNVVLVMHDITARVPNPVAEDFIRYEPRLQAVGKSSIRHRVREWLDHLLYIGYDLAVNKAGKAQGSGSRMIYPQELPWAMAKSRTLAEPMTFDSPGDGTLWGNLMPVPKEKA